MSSDNSAFQDNLVHETIAIEAVFVIVPTIAVVCRFVARRLKGISFWHDDWTALLALIWLWVYYALEMTSLSYGLGKHIVILTDEDQLMVRKLSFWYQIAYVLGPCTVKLSALFLYKRIFVSPKFSKWVDILLYIVGVWGFVALFVSIFNCTPIEAFWTTDGTCIILSVWVYVYGSINILLDFIVWLTPIPIIWQLQLPLHQHISLTVIFVFGLADCAAAVARLIITGHTFNVVDFTYEWTLPGWWSLIHPSLGIVAICLPTMKVFLVNFRRMLGITHNSTAIDTKASILSKPDRWLKGGRHYDELDAATASLAGNASRDVHNNAIALAVQRPPSAESAEIDLVADNEIRITNDVEVHRTAARPTSEHPNLPVYAQ